MIMKLSVKPIAVQHEEAHQERGRNGGAHKQARAQAERCHDDDHHQHDGEHDRVRQRAQLVADVGRLVEQIVDMHAGAASISAASATSICGPARLFSMTLAPMRLVTSMRDGALAVQRGVARRVVEGRVDLRPRP